MLRGRGGAQMSNDEDTGTGWPAGQTKELPVAGSAGPHETVHLVLEQGAPPRRGFVSRWSGRLAFLTFTAAALVLVLAATNLVGLWHFSNPFAEKKTDRSQPALLLSIQDLARFEAASGNFQVIIDVKESRRFVPDILFSQRSLFVAAGSVDAYVDFTNIGTSDISTSADHKTVTVHLPAPALEAPNLDVNRSYVYSSQEGLINKIGDLFNNDANKQQELYQLAQQKIAAAAADSGLKDRAETNTKIMLTEMLRSLGYTSINVVFPAT
jgi:Protein of unknown function (DUF4230)